MNAYASRTGTITTLRALRRAKWRLLVSATGEHRDEGFRICVDNGEWTRYQRELKTGIPQDFDEVRFNQVVNKFGATADFTVAPDRVGAGRRSLELSLEWLPDLLTRCRRVLIAVQEGIEPHDISDLLSYRVGIFVGGKDAAWKEATMSTWGALARSRGAYCHVGRVNTARRIALCGAARVDSFDGTSVTRFPSTLPELEAARARYSFKPQTNLF